MNDRFNNKGRKSGRGQQMPQRTTADNFQLNLKEEDFNTNSSNIPQRRRDMTTSEHYASKQLYYNEKERKKQDKEHKKRNRIKAGKNKRVFSLVWIAMVLLISFTMSSFLITGSNDFLAVERKEVVRDAVEINMPENLTIKQLSKILADNGVIDSEFFFNLFCEVTSADKKLGNIEPGECRVDTNLDYLAIINTLMSGKVNREVVKIVFPEGVSAMDIAELFEENKIASKEDALDAMNESMYGAYELVQGLNNEDSRIYKLEGYMFPDTYQFYTDEGAVSAIKKMLQNSETKLVMVQDTIDKSGMTTDEVIALASIIQREAANVDDMYNVSAVLHNRLEQGEGEMKKLQCDSTTFYPYHTKNDLPEGEKDYISIYNTYDVEGLPVGPICNPGIDAIKAALLPAESHREYYYFCHSDEGEAFYGRTAEEHEANKVAAGLVQAGGEEQQEVQE